MKKISNDRTRKNDEIRAKEVRLISADGEQLGVVSRDEALAQAYGLELDLVEISPNAAPPVCKIMDYGKYRFEKEKKAKEAKKNQKQIDIKEIRFSPQIGEHDYQFKLKKAIEFLKNGDKVFFRLRYRGREIMHKDIGFDVFKKLEEDLVDIAKIEKAAKLEGRFLSMLVAPLKNK